MSRQTFLDAAAVEAAALALAPPADALARGDDAAQEAGVVVQLGPAESRHVRVKRIREGEQFDVVDGGGRRMVVELAGEDPAVPAGEEKVAVRVLRMYDDAAQTRALPRLVLVQALAKGDRDLQAVESCVEIGVDGIIPWQADRSIVRWKGERAAKAHAKWQSTVRAATKQSRRALEPQLEDLATSRVLTRRIAETTAAGGTAFVLHEEATGNLGALAGRLIDTDSGRLRQDGVASEAPQPPEILLVVGPEGGITPDEVRSFADAGAHPATLGPNILRASTAGAVAAVLIRDRLGLY